MTMHRFGLVAAGMLLGAGMAGPVSAAPAVGQPAPAFQETDVDGSPVSLEQFRGRTVVLEWTNHQCPYVAKHYDTGNMQALQKSFTDDGVVWLTVISSAPGEQGHVDAATAKSLNRQREAQPSRVLLDTDGDMGRAYGATNTPHMYVIAGDGRLAYMGAIDDRPTARHSDVEGANNYVAAALDAVEDGRSPDPAQTRAYGCTVKYGS